MIVDREIQISKRGNDNFERKDMCVHIWNMPIYSGRKGEGGASAYHTHFYLKECINRW